MRHSALIPFSHDHHESLLVALRLKKGGPSSPHDILWPQEPKQQAEALVRFAERELYPHFELEEAMLFPSAEAASPELAAIVTVLLGEHRSMREELARLESELDPAALPEMLRAFGEMLDRHIRREERELFPLVEAAIADATLTLDEAAIGAIRDNYKKGSGEA